MSYAEALSKISEIQARIAEIDPRQAQVADPAAFADALQAAVGNSPTYGSQAARDPLDPLNPTAATATTATATPVAVTGDAGGATQYDGMILEAARAQGVDPALLKALVRAESNFDPNAVSHAGAQGLTQLMPATAAGFGVTNPFDPMQSLNAGARFLHNSLAMFNGDPSLALAAYNAGPGAVQKYGGIPPYSETQAYVPKVLAYYDQYRAQGFGGPPPTLSAVATGPAPVTPQQAGGSSPAAAQALGAAQRQLGTPYVWGGEQPGGFDCSGLMQWAYGQQGVQIPRVAADQARAGQAVPRDQLAPGDLVYFADSSGYVHHIGMYVGGDKFLHAPHTGDVVKISSLSESHYAREYAGARRVA